MREASHELAVADESGLGVLTIGANPTLAPFLLPEAILGFSVVCPKATLELREDVSERLIEGILTAELDLALVSPPVEHEEIDIDVLGCDSLLVAVAPSHPFAERASVTVAELAEQPGVVLDETHCLGRQVSELCRAMKLNLRVACRASQLATVLELAALGVGVAVVPGLSARSMCAHRCRLLPISDETPLREVAVAMRKGRTRSMLVDRFLAGLHWPAQFAVAVAAG